MRNFIDFNCTYDNAAGISESVCKKLNLSFPDAYLDGETIALISKAIQDEEGIPFWHTVEAEAMGADINLGDEKSVPRAGSFVCTELDELLQFLSIDSSHILKALRKEQDKMKEVLDKFRVQILQFMQQGVLAGINILSYADSMGSLSVLGPKYLE